MVSTRSMFPRWVMLSVYSHAVGATECLVGCLVQGISPFDDANLAVWDDRSVCDSSTVDCEVSAITYPSASYQGTLWVSTSGTDGSSGCTCSICDPYPGSDTTSYMEDETSLWSRIHCYLVASEASGYDVSPCVAAIVDTGTLPCVDDVYEPPTVDQSECEANGIKDQSIYDSWKECNWIGEYRSTDELHGSTREPSPLPGPTAAPATSTARDITPEPAITLTNSPDPTPTAPSVIPPPIINGPLAGSTSTASPDPTPAAPSVSLPSANGPQPSTTSTMYPYSTPSPSPGTSLPSAGGSSLPIDVEGGETCSVGSTCKADYCCHPDTSKCGRRYTFCQQRDFSDGPRCCSGVDGDPSASNVCSEDSICVKPSGRTLGEVFGRWLRILGGPITIGVLIGGGCKCYTKKRKDARPK